MISETLRKVRTKSKLYLLREIGGKEWKERLHSLKRGIRKNMK